MIANIDKVNETTKQLIPLRAVDDQELIRELYDRGVTITHIEMMFNCLNDYYVGANGEGFAPWQK